MEPTRRLPRSTTLILRVPLSRKTNPKKSGSTAFGGSDKLKKKKKKKIADLELAEIDCPTGQDLGTPPEAASW
jgi:hypothetical protein